MGYWSTGYRGLRRATDRSEPSRAEPSRSTLCRLASRIGTIAVIPAGRADNAAVPLVHLGPAQIAEDLRVVGALLLAGFLRGPRGFRLRRRFGLLRGFTHRLKRSTAKASI